MKRDDCAACAELEQDLVLFHYGELNGGEGQHVEAHVKDCPGCARYLAELGQLLPKTVLADEPTQAFWNDYSRELRRKLDDFGEPRSWSRNWIFRFQPWLTPALAATALVALALTFTLGKGVWQSPETPPRVDEAIFEVLPITENLEFFRNLEVLDALEVLEQMGDPQKGSA